MGNGFENFDNPGYYYGDFGNVEYGIEILGGVAGFILVVSLLMYLAMIAFAIVSYVFSSLGIYTIAKRRGIRQPWLAWIPIGSMWTVGSISDQYQYVTKGNVRNRRKVLLGLYIGLLAALFIALLSMFVGMIVSAFVDAMLIVLVVVLSWVAILVLEIVLLVYYYIAMYDVYRSCNPDNAVVNLLLSIFVSVATPFLIFACRSKDLGMPPRKVAQPTPAAAEEAPAAEIVTVEAEAPKAEG